MLSLDIQLILSVCTILISLATSYIFLREKVVRLDEQLINRKEQNELILKRLDKNDQQLEEIKEAINQSKITLEKLSTVLQINQNQ